MARRVLEHPAGADEGTRCALDAALRTRSNEPALHAAALAVAHAQGADLQLTRSHPRGWVLGLNELVSRGQLAAAGYAAPRLHEAFPQMPYLDYLALIFRRLPPAPQRPRRPFLDDRLSDVQVVGSPGAETAVLAFCGSGHQLGLSLNLLDRWLAQIDCHVIYLRDRRVVGYREGIAALGRDMPATVRRLREITRGLGASRLVCLGNSAGATGALRYARPLGAQRVLALAPITGGPEYERQVRPHLREGAVMPWTDLVPLLRRGPRVRTAVLYGEKNRGDLQQSMRLAGLPGVTVNAVPDWDSHHLIGGLIRANRLDHVLRWLTSHDDSLDLRSPAPARRTP